jgi:hypothetical protein
MHALYACIFVWQEALCLQMEQARIDKVFNERRAQTLGLMIEGNSIRAIVRMTGASKNTIVKQLGDAGEAVHLEECGRCRSDDHRGRACP